ncbi:MAG: chromate transporter [Burkholderiaceae bacterium]|nr:chromate transporter [Burkholderiaceae bacterium]
MNVSKPEPLRRPASLWQLFLVFSGLALRGFGGVLPWAERAIVDEQRWLDQRDFVEMLALAQVLPGPNVCNLALMIGDRYFGLRGAIVALAGMMLAPLAVVLALAALYVQFSDVPTVAAALRGMGAAAAGMIIATAWKMARTQRDDRAAWVFLAAAFVAMGLLRWPLLWVMPAIGAVSVALAWARQRR